MSQIRFYFAPGACSLAPHILLRETGIKFEAIANVVNKKEVTFTNNFASINPKMRVPVISIDGEVTTELPAVATAIAGLAPDRYFVGRTALETLRVYEWMNWLSGTLHGQGFGALFRPERYSDDPAAFSGIKTKAFKWIRECFDFIEGKLVGGYAVGDALTIVDPYLFVFFRWGNDVGFQMKQDYPKYTVLVSNLVQRPAVEQTLKVEDILSTL